MGSTIQLRKRSAQLPSGDVQGSFHSIGSFLQVVIAGLADRCRFVAPLMVLFQAAAETGCRWAEPPAGKSRSNGSCPAHRSEGGIGCSFAASASHWRKFHERNEHRAGKGWSSGRADE